MLHSTESSQLPIFLFTQIIDEKTEGPAEVGSPSQPDSTALCSLQLCALVTLSTTLLLASLLEKLPAVLSLAPGHLYS